MGLLSWIIQVGQMCSLGSLIRERQESQRPKNAMWGQKGNVIRGHDPKECRQPLEGRTDKETDSPIELPKGISPINNLLLTP